MDENELLRKQLDDATAEIEMQKLRVSNVMLLLKNEMTLSGRLPESIRPPSGDSQKFVDL